MRFQEPQLTREDMREVLGALGSRIYELVLRRVGAGLLIERNAEPSLEALSQLGHIEPGAPEGSVTTQ